MWIQGGVKFSVQRLKTHLLQTLLELHLINNKSPEIQLPKRKVLPKLGEATLDYAIKNKEKYKK